MSAQKAPAAAVLRIAAARGWCRCRRCPSYGWKKFQENAVPLILAFIIPGVASFILNIFTSLIIKSLFLNLVFSIIGIVVQAALGIGIYRVALQITAGEPADLGKAFTYDRWGEWILFSSCTAS